MPDKIHLTVATLVVRDSRFLMVKETIGGKTVINQPAGHVEPGEDIINAALRETVEETGWDVEIKDFVGIYTYKSAHNEVTYYRLVFTATAVSLDAQRPLDPDIDEALWMSIDEIRDNKINLRSDLVLQCIEDYLEGKVFPLEIIRNRL